MRYEVKYSKGGFGQVYKGRSKRPYAIRDNQENRWVRTARGEIRTFGSRGVAQARADALARGTA